MSGTRIDVTVITLTRRRVTLLQRAIASVAFQKTGACIEHLVMIDDCRDTMAFSHEAAPHPEMRWLFDEREPADQSGPARSAVLRNRAVIAAKGTWIAFLDDDNEYEPDHIESLLACAGASGCRAVHSWLQMFHASGEPFIEPFDPWRADPEESNRQYLWALDRGVRIPGSNVFRDRLDPPSVENPVRTVDTSEWLLRADLLRALPFPESYPEPTSGGAIFGEDDAYIKQLVAHGEPVACSERPTLRYYLGGYSNSGIFL